MGWVLSRVVLYSIGAWILGGYLHGEQIKPVFGTHGMVVAGHPEAAEIGRDILERGGNAMDAVVATSLALGVAEPYGSGLGGKCVILYYEADSGKVWFIDGMDGAGAAFDPQELGSMSAEERDEGAAGIGVPGLLAALELGHSRWGSQPWKELVRPAAELARNGFMMVEGMGIFFERRIDRIQSHPETARLYLPGGKVPEEGTRLANPDLARTLEGIAELGRAGFYEGEVAERMVKEIRAGGGHLGIEDFRDYRARLGQPISIEVGDLTIFSGGPPTTGGATAFLSLKVLEAHDWNRTEGFHSASNLDAWARVLRHIYPRIQAAIADSPQSPPAWQAMIEPASLAELRRAAGLDSREGVHPVETAGIHCRDRTSRFTSLAADGWTTHFVVADRFGNMASVTQSLSHHFGSGVTAPGTGVVLNNSLKNFSFSDPSGVNYGAPGKRPRSTIAPVIALKNGRPVFALGLPGGGRIPTTTSAVLADHLFFGSGLGEAISVPRVHLLRSWSDEPDSHILQTEGGLPHALASVLDEMGWEVEEVTDSEFFGGMTAVERTQEGTFTGWADYRRTNHAAGY